MSETSSEFREEVRKVVRRHDPPADQLRTLAADLDQLADRYDTQERIL
jgi:hypothetical protein